MTARAPIAVFGTAFQNPILLAAGTAGFGREVADVIHLENLGGIITKAVSPEPRLGYPPPRVAEFAGGMLNAVGLANPGVQQVATVELPWLAATLTRARVVVNVVGSVAEEFAAVVSRLGELDVVTAFELNVSCPNTARGGEEFCADPEVLADLVALCRAATERALIVKLPPTLSDVTRAVSAAGEAGVDGFSLVNTLPSALYRFPEGTTFAPGSRLGFGEGGVSGPALLPIGVGATRCVREHTDLPIIGVGGIRSIADVRKYLAVGATLVAVGTGALADPRLPERLVRAWHAHG